MKKQFLYGCLLRVVFIVVVFIVFFSLATTLDTPQSIDLSLLEKEREEVSENFYKLDNSWLKKNDYGLWELYVEGEPFERGVIKGKLTKELIISQEDAFINQIKKIVPSTTYLKFLKHLIRWFNRNLDEYITDEYQQEIYGVSFSASDEYGYIGTKYERLLNYHASHDIGHALKELNMVGCSSFSVWDDESADSSLLVGRNFDLYLGDEFAEDKIVAFINPSQGYKFMSVSWGGMVGVVSGMNEKGLTVTINAARSEIPASSQTPVSILVREILQYASNIDEAYAIAEKRQIFVSESIMIGSLADNMTAIIEKSPEKIGLLEPDGNRIICTNHYQGDTFASDSLNIQNLKESASGYRYKRIKQLLDNVDSVDYMAVASILRDRKGLNDTTIGNGNEKAINQMLGHHSVIFKPSELKVWISTKPWQLGKYLCYGLNQVFNNDMVVKQPTTTYSEEYNIPVDSFSLSKEFTQYVRYRGMTEDIKNCIDSDTPGQCNISVNDYVGTNPDYYYVYSLAGDLLKADSNYREATTYYNKALQREIPTLTEKNHIQEKLNSALDLIHE